MNSRKFQQLLPTLIWQYGLSSFQERDTTLDSFLNENNQIELHIVLYEQCRQKVPKSDFQSQFFYV